VNLSSARRPLARALLVALRPGLWSKNAFVFAALILTGDLLIPAKSVAVLATFLVFAAASSAVYLVNDWADRTSDRLHPEKRFRPIAAGELPPVMALSTAVLLALTALVVGFGLDRWIVAGPPVCRPVAAGCLVGWVVVAYLGLQLAYTFVLKRLVIIEVLAIAGGFVLRVLAGGAAIDREISAYLYLSVIFLALFQGFAKRRHELTMLDTAAEQHRRSLGEYTLPFLDHVITVAATATVVTYSLYAVNTPLRPVTIPANALLLTIPFVLYAVFRYLYLVQVEGMGGTPEEMLLQDRLLLLDVVGWVAVLLLILYGSPG
jgi:4-hydroxybenzoate polyprenyltransferase